MTVLLYGPTERPPEFAWLESWSNLLRTHTVSDWAMPESSGTKYYRPYYLKPESILQKVPPFRLVPQAIRSLVDSRWSEFLGWRTAESDGGPKGDEVLYNIDCNLTSNFFLVMTCSWSRYGLLDRLEGDRIVCQLLHCRIVLPLFLP